MPPSPRRVVPPCRRGRARARRAAAACGAVCGLVGLAAGGRAGAQPLDTARALGALRDAEAACRADGGALWGRPLCGPLALVDRETRLVLTNDTVAGRRFVPVAAGPPPHAVTTLPPGQFVANTAFAWGGRRWAMVTLPLPADRFARAALLAHEGFHREQPALGLAQPDAASNHLDTRAGRTWLRLELRALAAALDALGTPAAGAAAARRHAEAALLFRAARRAAFPGSDSLEATLEVQEGLAEYTGARLAMGLTGEGPARVARAVRVVEATTPSFVRSFAYGTGPAVGLLLDRFAPAWRPTLRAAPAGRRDPGAQLAAALGARPPAARALGPAARARAEAYGWAEVDRAEAARDSARAPAVAGYRARLVDGPTLTLRQGGGALSWSFDPSALVGLDLRTTVYPSGSFTGPWGTLAVERGGVLVANDLSELRVAAPPAAGDGAARQVRGDGWTLTLAPGWALGPDPARPGGVVVSEAPGAGAR